MDPLPQCPQCGCERPADGPAGLCPDCLLKLGLEGGPSEAIAPTMDSPPPESVAFIPPSLEEMSERFPQLELLELLGQGGMGAVYLARQPRLDRLVALKILPPQLGRDPTFAERFSREAQALAKLNHPNIVTVYDFGDAEGLFYLLMEFVDGINLRQSIKTGRLSPEEALAIVPQICDALQFAHDEGIVHRDVKPENVLLDTRGRVKIADFGLAKLVRGAPLRPLTISHQVMGTVHYMAPEQLERPLEVDHRADIYSLGVVFYELLTGELPIGRFDPPSRKTRLDAQLDTVVMRALEKEVERRYQHASEVTTDIDRIRQGGAAAPSTPRMPQADSGTAVPNPDAVSRSAAIGRWPAVTLLVSVLLMLLTFVSWDIPPAARPLLHGEVQLDEIHARFDTRASREGDAFSPWTSSLVVSFEEIRTVLPGWLLFGIPLLIGAGAVVRGWTGAGWPVPLQGVLALLGLAHVMLLMAVMVELGLGVQLLPMLAGFAVLALIPPLVGIKRIVRFAAAQPYRSQLRTAAAGVMLTAGGLFLLLSFNFAALLIQLRQGLSLDGGGMVIAALLFALWVLSGLVCLAGWRLFGLRSDGLVRVGALLSPPFGWCALWLLARPELAELRSSTEPVDAQADEARTPPVRPPKPRETADRRVRRLVRGPANGLIVVGGLDMLLLLASLMMGVSSTQVRRGPEVLAAHPAQAAVFLLAQDMPMAQQSPERNYAVWTLLPMVLVLVFTVPIAGLTMLGGMKMKQFELYGLAVVASVLAMLPCHAGFLFGLPVGLWSLMVLLREDVRSAFAAGSRAGAALPVAKHGP